MSDLILSPQSQHPSYCYLSRLAAGSRPTMLAALNLIAGLISGGTQPADRIRWWDLRYSHTAVIRAALVEKYAASTTNKMLAALRGVLKECWRLGLMNAEDFQRAIDLPPVKGSKLLRGRALNGSEIAALLAACDNSPGGIRDAAVIAVLVGAGLRRSELVSLDLADWADGAVRIRAGKGNKDRLTYVATGTDGYVESWIGIRGKDPGALFLPILKSHRIVRRRLTDKAVWWILECRRARAGVDPFSPHDLRRTFITSLLDVGGDISSVQKLAGHANVATTIRYDRRSDAARKQVARGFVLP